LLELADGEVVFYKTLNNILWHPRHIQAHLEEMKRNKTKWGFSHVEYQDIDLGEHPYNALAYRVNDAPPADRVSIDEICHLSSLKTDWNQCLRQDKNGTPYFVSGFVAEQWVKDGNRGTIPPEITIVNWVKNPSKKQVEDTEAFKANIGAPAIKEPEQTSSVVDGEIVIDRKWPTIVGNVSFDSFNKNILTQFEASKNKADVKNIAVKRTMGMGDVLVVEPIIRKLKQKYPNANIDFFTAKPDIVKYFDTKPDQTKTIEDSDIIKDYLYTVDNYDLRFDLDLSYESREYVSFVDAYADICSLDFDNQSDKHINMDTSTLKKIESDKPIAVIAADGSGWPGKTWPITFYEDVIEYLQSQNYLVIETGNVVTDLTPKEYHNCDFETFVNCVYSCDLFIGADNGPMHVARALNKPSVTIAGAALPYYTNPNRTNIYYVENSLSETWGIKHHFFFDVNKGSLNFVPSDEKDNFSGIRDISSNHVIKAIEKINKDGYSFNMSGSIVRDDVIGGFAYYDHRYGLERENKFYHPDQRMDLSQYYENVVEDYFSKYLNSSFDYVSSRADKEIKILDVGCNMGIMVDALNKDGFTNVEGIDINRKSIEKGKLIFTDIAERINKNNILDFQTQQKYDLVLCNDVISKTHDPLLVLNNIKNTLNVDGKILLSSELFDTSYVDQRDERLSIGENIYLFSESSINNLFADAELKVKETFSDDSGFNFYILERG